MTRRDRRRPAALSTESAAPYACPHHVRLDVLGRVPLLDGLPESEIRALDAKARAPGYHTDETIYQIGDPADSLHVVATGAVKLMRTTAAGQTFITNILGPGEAFGTLGDQDSYPDQATAMMPTCALRIPVRTMRQLMERYPRISLSTLDQLSDRFEESQQMIGRLSTSRVDARIAAALLVLVDKLGERHGRSVEIPLTQADLAAVVGTTPESVSRALRRLRARGIVDTGRRLMTVLDPVALEQLAAD